MTDPTDCPPGAACALPAPGTHNPLDPTTFTPPSPLQSPYVVIEFCDRCRWLHRAQWVSTELLLTFPPPALKSITVIPLNLEETAGRFRVWLFHEPSTEDPSADTPSVQTGSPYGPGIQLLWDRKIEGGFPELKVLKQRIRDRIQPGKSLGHSDKSKSE